MTNPGLRASDEDRRRVAGALERHTTTGRLSLDEFSERLARVHLAATHADLAGILHDLPADDPPRPAAGRPHLLLAFLVALVTVAILGIVLAISRR